MKKLIREIMSFIKDIISPKKCYSCNKEGSFLCDRCFLKLKDFKETCYVCKKISPGFLIHSHCKTGVYYDNIVIFGHYKNHIMSKLIKDSKFYNNKDILIEISKNLSDYFSKYFKEKNFENYIVSSVPMSFLRKLKRGYNHSHVLASKFAENLSIDYRGDLLYRFKHTRQQSKLNKIERKINLQNCFKINKKLIKYIDKKTIIIVDDVVSTGTTINELAKILKLNGAKKVIGVVLSSN